MNPAVATTSSPPVPGTRAVLTLGSVVVIAVGSYLLGWWVGHDVLHAVSARTGPELRLFALGVVITMTVPFAVSGVVRMWPGDPRPRFHPIADPLALASLAFLWPLWSTQPVSGWHPAKEYSAEFGYLIERLAVAEVVMITFGSMSVLLLLIPGLMQRGSLLYVWFFGSLVGAVWLIDTYVSMGL